MLGSWSHFGLGGGKAQSRRKGEPLYWPSQFVLVLDCAFNSMEACAGSLDERHRRVVLIGRKFDGRSRGYGECVGGS